MRDNTKARLLPGRALSMTGAGAADKKPPEVRPPHTGLRGVCNAPKERAYGNRPYTRRSKHNSKKPSLPRL